MLHLLLSMFKHNKMAHAAPQCKFKSDFCLGSYDSPVFLTPVRAAIAINSVCLILMTIRLNAFDPCKEMADRLLPVQQSRLRKAILN